LIELAIEFLGIEISWEGNGVDEVGRVIATADQQGPKPDDIIVRIDPLCFRLIDVGTLLGDATKAKKILGWKPKTSFAGLVEEMIKEDLQMAQRDIIFATEGYPVFDHHE
jgi:GDPmannose 4,6-dehydratase